MKLKKNKKKSKEKKTGQVHEPNMHTSLKKTHTCGPRKGWPT